jgi:ABC-2 type transport system ATP-binding protein
LEADGGIGKVLNFDIYEEHKKIRSKVSLVAPTADVGTDNNLTVRQNLEFWAVVYDLEKEQRKDRIDEMLEFLNLRQYEHHWPMSISAGNRQKLAIARSLLVKNPILFLDEPTVKLDAKGAESIRELVKRINHEYGITVILTTHYIFEAEELCERVAIMHRGKIISSDTVANLRRNLQRYDELIIGCNHADDEITNVIKSMPFVVGCNRTDSGLTIQMENLHERLNDVLRILRGQGVQITRINTHEPTLEDIFVDTIGEGSVN